MLEAMIPYVQPGTAALVVAVLVRWGLKVDKALATQNTATERLIERISGHEKLDDARFEALHRLIDQTLASNGRPG